MSRYLHFADTDMSTKTLAQMEAVLMDKIDKARDQLSYLQRKQKIQIGTLAYKHGLHLLDLAQLDNAFAKIAQEVHHDPH